MGEPKQQMLEPNKRRRAALEWARGAPSAIEAQKAGSRIDQNNPPELLNLLFNHIFYKRDPTNTKKTLNFSYVFLMIFVIHHDRLRDHLGLVQGWESDC